MNFIFMLTQDDTTVPKAAEVYDRVRGTALRYVGFKDIGASPEELAVVADKAHADRLEVMLEVVSTSKSSELASLEAARRIGVDWVLGGTHAEEGVEILHGSGIKYCPFPGKVDGHPSVLQGSMSEIVDDARRLGSLEGVFGLDLLAYRHASLDAVALAREVVKASAGPVIVAGSISTSEQVKKVASVGAWAFTIGTAIFEGLLPGGPDLAAQVSEVLKIAELLGASPAEQP